MAKFIVTFKKESGNRGTKQYVPVGFEVEVNANSSATPHESEVKKAVEETYKYIKERGAKPFNYYLNLEIINEKTPKTWTEKKI